MADPSKMGNLPGMNPGPPVLAGQSPGPPDLARVSPGPPELAGHNPGPPDLADMHSGPPDFGNSESARLIKGDPAKDVELMQHFLSELKTGKASKIHDIPSKLKSSDLSRLSDVLHEYQKISNKESHDEPKGDALDQRLRLSLKDADLKNLLDEMGKGGAGAEALAMLLVTNIAEAGGGIGSTLGAIQGEGKRRTRRNLVMLGAAGLILLLGLLVGIGWLGPSAGKPPVPQAVAQDPNVGVLVRPTGTPICALNLINPAKADKIPDSGALNVQWSSVPGAASYALKVIPPPEVSVPWLFPTKGNSRTIYMENFAAAGDYQFSVDALDAQGGVLCGVALKFRKSAYVPPSGKKGDTGGGSACTSAGMFVTCP
jgi:hypothetical protein